MDKDISSIDNDGNYQQNIDLDEKNEENEVTFDVFGNPIKPKKHLDKKWLLIPLIVLALFVIIWTISTITKNHYSLVTKSIVIKVDEQKRIELKGNDKVKKKITFTSQDADVATVNRDGVVTGKKEGNTIIYVGINGKKDKKISVLVETNKETLKLKNENIKVAKDETFQLEVANVLDGDVFEWRSNNENVAIVDNNGLAKGVHAGVTTISVKERDGRTTATRVTVVSDEVLIDKISLQDMTIAVGENVTLKPVVEPTNALKILLWSTNNDKVVTVDEKGQIGGMAKGTATITVTTHDGKTARAKVTVDDTIPASIKIDNCTGGIAINTPIDLKAVYSPTTAKANVVWSSSNTAIATVSNGRVSAKKVGDVTITATTSNGKVAKCRLKVSPMNVNKLEISPLSITLDQEATKKLYVSFVPSSAKEYYTIKWTSSNKNVATVDNNGVVTAKNPGTATITATAGGKSASTKVVVNATSVTAVKMTGCQSVGKVGEKITLKASVLPDTAKNKTIQWSSSNTQVATVSNGLVRFNDTGKAVITASTSNGQKATCSIEVLKPDVTSLTLSKTSISLKVNSTTSVYATTNLSTAQFNKYYKLAWRITNPAIASITVDSGNSLRVTVKGLSKGYATIHATVGYRNQTIQVTVS